MCGNSLSYTYIYIKYISYMNLMKKRPTSHQQHRLLQKKTSSHWQRKFPITALIGDKRKIREHKPFAMISGTPMKFNFPFQKKNHQQESLYLYFITLHQSRLLQHTHIYRPLRFVSSFNISHLFSTVCLKLSNFIVQYKTKLPILENKLFQIFED